MKRAAIYCTPFLLAACATAPELPVGDAPVCEGPADCSAKWDSAQLFVVKHAGMKIQISTNVLIETYNPTNSSPNLGMRVTKEPLGGGQYKLVASAWCANIFGCMPAARPTIAEFNRIISLVAP